MFYSVETATVRRLLDGLFDDRADYTIFRVDLAITTGPLTGKFPVRNLIENHPKTVGDQVDEDYRQMVVFTETHSVLHGGVRLRPVEEVILPFLNEVETERVIPGGGGSRAESAFSSGGGASARAGERHTTVSRSVAVFMDVLLEQNKRYLVFRADDSSGTVTVSSRSW